MGRQRSLGRTLTPWPHRPALTWAILWGLAMSVPFTGRAQGPGSSTPPASEKVAIERQPYRILVNLVCDPSARIDAARRAELIREWQVLVRRFIGAPWVVAIAPASSPVCHLDPESVKPEAFASAGPFDKVWLIRIAYADTGSGLVFEGREYDMVTRGLGTLRRRSVPAICDMARELLEFTQGLFNPTALISGQEGGRALLTVRGASIAPASPVGAVVSVGTVFQPLRLATTKDKGIQIRRIPFTYLRVEAVEGAVARCTITSWLSDPLTKRISGATTLAAVGVKPGSSPTTLRFATEPDKAPASGYLLTYRTVAEGQPRELGLTDRTGSIVLKPGFADSLVILRLLAGNVEPMAEFPLMPGEIVEKLPLMFVPKPLTVALEAQLDSLRDEVVDVVALRARLEARMKARLEGEDWDGLAATIEEFSKLTPRDTFAERLTKLKDEAARTQTQQKKAVLTKTAQAQISDLLAIIDRYLDDDVFRAYSESLERGQTAADGKAKAVAKAQAKPAVPKPPASALVSKNAPAAKEGAPKNPLTPPAASPNTKPEKPAPPASNVPF
jgi:hypothetical protein